MIKNDERKINDGSEMQVGCVNLKKKLTPLKYIAITSLLLLPYFEVPGWCITEGLNRLED
jgi:hypothetical protein